MNPKDTLRPYIEAHLEKNISIEVIRHGLVSHGWDTSVVDAVISDIAGEPSLELKQELQSIARSYTKQNYNAIDAIKDVISVFSVNPKVISLIIIVGAIVTAFAELGTARINSMAKEQLGNDQDFLHLILFIGIQIASILLVLGIGWGITVTALWIIVNDSKDGLKVSAIQRLRSALPRSIRVIIATMLFGLIAVSPIIVAVILIQAAVTWLSFGLEIGLLFLILSFFFAIYLALKYVLVPVIALFEPEIKYMHLFARARHLMSAGGMLFMLQILIPVIIVNLAVTFLFPKANMLDGSISAVTLIHSFAVSAISLIISCMWLMFYRNRKIVRG